MPVAAMFTADWATLRLGLRTLGLPRSPGLRAHSVALRQAEPRRVLRAVLDPCGLQSPRPLGGAQAQQHTVRGEAGGAAIALVLHIPHGAGDAGDAVVAVPAGQARVGGDL